MKESKSQRNKKKPPQSESEEKSDDKSEYTDHDVNDRTSHNDQIIEKPSRLYNSKSQGPRKKMNRDASNDFGIKMPGSEHETLKVSHPSNVRLENQQKLLKLQSDASVSYVDTDHNMLQINQVDYGEDQAEKKTINEKKRTVDQKYRKGGRKIKILTEL